MSFISKYVDKRVAGYIDSMQHNYQALSFYRDDLQYKQELYKWMYKGTPDELLYYYKTHKPRGIYYNRNDFMNVFNDPTLPLMTYPLPKIVTNAMVSLIFGNEPNIMITDVNGNEKTELEDTLKDICEENDFLKLLRDGATNESYSGAVAFKPIMDPDFSEYPIFIPYAKESFSIEYKYGKPVMVIFKDDYDTGDKDKTTYQLLTICGIGFINYKLYKGKEGRDLREVPLTDLDDTAGLHRLDFFKKDGTKYKKLTAIVKENKTNSVSDYEGIMDDFQALCEIYSNMIDFIRKSRTYEYMPENLLEIDVNTGKKIIPHQYNRSTVILHDDNPEGNEQKVSRDVVDTQDSLNGFKEAFNNVLLNALTTVGLSPATVGLDMAGANSSALALNIRERASLRTRDEKMRGWTKAIKRLVEFMLELYDASASGDKIYINELEDTISVKFSDYESPSYDQKIQSISVAMQNNLIDLDTALKELYPDKSDEDLEIMKANIESQLPSADDIVDNELSDDEEDENDEKD